MDLVHKWLSQHGISDFHHSPARDWISILVNVSSAERLLNTKYSVFEHKDGSQLIRTLEWSLPQNLHELVDTIQPTTSFMLPRGQRFLSILSDELYTPPGFRTPAQDSIAKACSITSVTIDCFNNLYGTLNYQQKSTATNKIGFTNYLKQAPIRPDVEAFLEEYNPSAASNAYAFRSIEIAGGPPAVNQSLTQADLDAAGMQNNWVEANLDAQTILGMVGSPQVYSYSTGGSPPFEADLHTTTNTNEPYLTWLNYLSGQQDIPQVISTSYGDDEQTGKFLENACLILRIFRF